MPSTKLAALGGALSIVLAGSTFFPPDAEARTAASHTARTVNHAKVVTHNNTAKPVRQTHANFSHPRNHTGAIHTTTSKPLRQTHANFSHPSKLAHKGGGAGGGASGGTTNTGGGVTKVVRNQGGSGGGTNTGTSNTGTTKTGNTKTGLQQTGTQKTGSAPHVLSHGPHQSVKVAVNLTVQPKYPAVHLHNTYFPIHRAPYRLFVGGVARTFVPLAALGIVRIDGAYWNPDGYVRVARRFCQGAAENGCMLYWRMVDFEGGGSDAQCVQYCPHTGPAPANFVEAPPHPPAPPQGSSCELTIFAEPNFGGGSAPTGESQPDVAAAGWQNAISSIQVQSGIWDFFMDANFSGESMRLQAGDYATLPKGWDKKIASFQCVQRSVASAQ